MKILDKELVVDVFKSAVSKEQLFMTKEEMKEYLKSTNKTVPVKDLVERFIKIDKEFNGEPWNILQILTNIDMIVPVEDRK